MRARRGAPHRDPRRRTADRDRQRLVYPQMELCQSRVVRRLRRLVRRQALRRFRVGRADFVDPHFFIDVQQSRRSGDQVRNDLRPGGAAADGAERVVAHRFEQCLKWRCIDDDVDLEPCDVVSCLGFVVGRQGDRRLRDDPSVNGEQRVFAVVRWSRRYGFAIGHRSDGQCVAPATFPRGFAERRSDDRCPRRRGDAELVGDQLDFMHGVRSMVRAEAGGRL